MAIWSEILYIYPYYPKYFSGCFLVFAIAKSIKIPLKSSAGITLKACRRGMRWIDALELLHLAGDRGPGERMGIGSPVKNEKNLGKNDGNEWKSIESMVVFRK